MNLLNFSLKVVEIYQLQARLIMATVTLFLCCLLGSVSLVYGQTLGELICSATSFNITVRNLVPLPV